MNRRKLLNRSIYSTLLAGGMCSAGGMLQMAKAASLQNGVVRGTNGYKALVCVFMDGGNDSTNMVVPRGVSEHDAYAQVRGDLALDRNSLLPISPANKGGRSWGLHPNLTCIQNLFNQDRAALVTNIGSLAYLRLILVPKFNPSLITIVSNAMVAPNPSLLWIWHKAILNWLTYLVFWFPVSIASNLVNPRSVTSFSKSIAATSYPVIACLEKPRH